MIELWRTKTGFRVAAVLVAGQALLMIVLAAFRVGGEEFINNIFDISSPFFAIVAVLAAYWGWKISNPREISRRIWGWLAVGLLLWALAELMWIYYTVQYHDTTPYPSPADAFWLVGYIPIFISMILRLRSFHVGLRGRQKWVLVGVNLVFAALSIHSIFWPMLQDYDPTRQLETLVNILYALCDLGLLAISLWIIFALQRGKYSTIWLLVAGSNIIRSIADLIFTYATWHEASLSESSFYTIYVIFNIPYLTSYLLLALGMVAYYEFLAESRITESTTPVHSDDISYSMALIFTNADNRVIGASHNLTGLVGAGSIKELKGLPLHELLGLEPAVVTAMLATGGQKGYINDFPLEIHTSARGRARAWVTATSDRWGGEVFNGLNITLRLRSGDSGLGELDTESDAIARRILSDTGQLSREKIALLKEYFRTLVLGLYVLVDNLAGKAVTANMLEKFNATAAHNHWEIHFDQQRFVIPDDYREEQLGNAFHFLLKTLVDYGVEVLNAQVISDEVKKIERQLSPQTLQAARDFGLRSL